ncbi:inosine/xanthosine triphosphatase [Patescibacteria group bacterium]|nr:inosine/xanthosine triphosphatase [Patescibacteria group bacterium]MCL5010413.1 inosine/xanthosine triphosphatase [Patescibacteria group bacterium]
MKEILLTSKNPAKVNATENTIAGIFKDYNIETIEVASGVSKTPDSDEEGIKGCLQRIEKAKKAYPNKDIYVGLEGIIRKNDYGTFLCGWCVVELPKEKRVGIGCSAQVKLPDFIADRVNTFEELSDLVETAYPSPLVSEINEIGTNGVITNRFYTRDHEFEDAIKCALGFALNDENYKKSHNSTDNSLPNS